MLPPPTTSASRPPNAGSRRRRWQKGIAKCSIPWRIDVTSGIAATIVGQTVRDRTIVTSLMMFIPPIVMAVVTWGTAVASKASWRSHVFSLIFTAAAVLQMVGVRRPTSVDPSTPAFRIVHWNVLWGGVRGEKSWPTLRQRLIEQQPDVVLLSEAPNPERLNELLATLGPTWTASRFHHAPRERYTCHIAIASRYPVILEDTITTADARMICARIELPHRIMRVLLVDGLSTITLLRTDRLIAVKDFVEQSSRDGKVIDVITGDFNAPGTCIRFDDFTTMAGGFHRASDFSRGWRGTWPNLLPMWDIDHVWVNHRNAITRVDLFTSLQTDHRGEAVDVALR